MSEMRRFLMYCFKCGKPIRKDAFYCQWCGIELDQQDTDWTVDRIKSLRQPSRDLEIAKYIARLWREDAYKADYDSFESFARQRLGMEKSIAFKYKDVGMKFLSEDGEPLIADAEQWGIGKLTKLLTLSIEEIRFFREKGLLDPNMTLAQLDDLLKRLREVRQNGY